MTPTTITSAFPRRASTVTPASSSNPSAPSPAIISPTPRSFRDKWLNDKRYKENRSPDLNNGNGFEDSLLVPLPLRRSTAVPQTRKTSVPGDATPASSPSTPPIATALVSLIPSKRKIFSRSKFTSVLSLLCLLAILRVVVQTFSPSSVLKPSLSASNFLAPIYLVPSVISRPFGSSAFSSSPPSPPKHHVVNGLLEVNLDVPAMQHPIYQLIEDAKVAWEEKNERQSKTLEQAVKEYKRRNNGMNPPKGFDHWWKFVQINNVGLPDEYDRINIDLAPFRAFSPSFLRSRISKTQEHEDTFTLSVQSGHVSTNHITYDSEKIGGSDDRRNGQVELIKSVAKWIPDFDAVYSIHDSPTRFISDMHREELIELAEDGEYYDPSVEMDTSRHGWEAACPPRSPIRAQPPLPAPTAKSFIVSHVATMDICQHPSVLGLHGTTAGVYPYTQGDLMPIFSLSKTKFHADILGIPVEQWGEDLPGDEVDWESKTDRRLLWRGRNTGGYFSTETPWRDSHRARLAKMVGFEMEDEVKVLPSPGNVAGVIENGETLGNLTREERMGRLNELMFDIGLAYEPIQCHSDDGTCADIERELTFRKVLTFDQETNYKYILDVDGNAWSARFKRLLTTGSLVLKSTIYPEWWNDRIQPWLHYVPVKVDYSDVYDIMAFFRGDDEDGLAGENELAKMIAKNGNEWSSKNWRKEDMTAYMFRLYLEWARLVSPKRGLMDFEFTAEPVFIPVGAGPNHRSPRTHAHLSALDKLRVVRPVLPEDEAPEESSE
ncbi:glycosyl transferase family 90-domain-containing protein [Mrakia frigida]|uniref:glycosyl transferase family 90-domain-containing protein n=1 Tax=Mrakia frigida TaxID=29902 RepID=UPI003FCC09CF